MRIWSKDNITRSEKKMSISGSLLQRKKRNCRNRNYGLKVLAKVHFNYAQNPCDVGEGILKYKFCNIRYQTIGIRTKCIRTGVGMDGRIRACPQITIQLHWLLRSIKYNLSFTDFDKLLLHSSLTHWTRSWESPFAVWNLEIHKLSPLLTVFFSSVYANIWDTGDEGRWREEMAIGTVGMWRRWRWGDHCHYRPHKWNQRLDWNARIRDCPVNFDSLNVN